MIHTWSQRYSVIGVIEYEERKVQPSDTPTTHLRLRPHFTKMKAHFLFGFSRRIKSNRILNIYTDVFGVVKGMWLSEEEVKEEPRGST